MKNEEILKNLEKCLIELDIIIAVGSSFKWNEDTLNAMGEVIDLLNYNYKELKCNIAKTHSASPYGSIVNNTEI